MTTKELFAIAACRRSNIPKMLRHKGCSERVWVEGPDNGIQLKRVLVAYDFSDHAELALNHALSFAQEYQSELHLLHVLPPYSIDASEISWYPLGQEGPITKQPYVCRGPLLRKRTFGATSNTLSARVNRIAKYLTTRKRTTLTLSVWERTGQVSECRRYLARMGMEDYVRLLAQYWSRARLSLQCRVRHSPNLALARINKSLLFSS